MVCKEHKKLDRQLVDAQSKEKRLYRCLVSKHATGKAIGRLFWRIIERKRYLWDFRIAGCHYCGKFIPERLLTPHSPEAPLP